ncbi:hypothetical protein RCS94_10870 [Orbaceae bacterium ac157xtp]
MDLFWGIFFSFPVIIFSTLLTLCILYWLVAAIGIFNIDYFDIDMDMDAEIGSTGLGGLLMKFGLNDVPLTLIITLISLIGWAISYLSCRFFLIYVYDYSTMLFYVIGTVVFVLTFIVAVYLTALFIKPIRPFFRKLQGTNSHRTLLGRTVEIRSMAVTTTKGEAIYEDGGAGLILQVRSDGITPFKRGDKAILLSYDATNNSYQIISINEFSEQ